MTFEKIRLGQEGESLAVAFLKKQGYHILEKNFKTALGEVDIIALDKDTICFIEVKLRTTYSKGTPFEAITKAKQRKLSQLALSYLKYKNWIEKKARFDVMAVTKDDQGENHVDILKNAFDLYGDYVY